MYCVKCGVELADSERKCPLCLTPVYFPELAEDPERPFPKTSPKVEKVNLRGVNFILTFAVLISGIISVFADLNTGEASWCGYVVGGLIVAYTFFVLPLWFVDRSPAIFVPVDFAVAALYIGHINYATGGDWYFTLALPIIGGLAAIVCTVSILVYYLRCGYLYIFGGATIALGGLSVLIEWLIHVTFAIPTHHLWSPYPAITLGLLGIMLIIIAIVKPFRESLARIFAL